MPASAQISMRSKPVTQSNGVVVRKSSIRKLPNVLVAETVVISFIILRKGEGLTSFHEDNSAHSFGEKKYNDDFRGVYFWDYAKKLKSNLVLVVVLDHAAACKVITKLLPALPR